MFLPLSKSILAVWLVSDVDLSVADEDVMASVKITPMIISIVISDISTVKYYRNRILYDYISSLLILINSFFKYVVLSQETNYKV